MSVFIDLCYNSDICNIYIAMYKALNINVREHGKVINLSVKITITTYKKENFNP